MARTLSDANPRKLTHTIATAIQYCLVLGIFTRLAALSVIIMMAVAMTKHVKNGYFANWSGEKNGEGVEFHLLYAGSALALLLTGPGPWSVDAWCMDIMHAIFG